MPLGPGRYDDICTAVRTKAKARGALVIIIDGEDGNGFSCQADSETTLRLPNILETVAREIRASLTRGKI